MFNGRYIEGIADGAFQAGHFGWFCAKAGKLFGPFCSKLAASAFCKKEEPRLTAPLQSADSPRA